MQKLGGQAPALKKSGGPSLPLVQTPMGLLVYNIGNIKSSEQLAATVNRTTA